MSSAIYVDFEAVKATPPAPAILGILIDRDGELRFEQVIVDSRLDAAVVAAPNLTVATLSETVARLTMLELPVVAWSVFDRELVAQADVDPALKHAWSDRYVNALALARTWRSKVHPGFTIVRASRFDAKHTLDQYAALAGCSNLARLRSGQPAKWIRHVQSQLLARRHYRRLTREAKRDWHNLLRYNRDDCHALRAIHRLASHELEKWRDYERADYVVFDGNREVRFRIGGNSTRMGALLHRHGAQRWAFLTAWNPGSQPLPGSENDARQNALLERLISGGFQCLRGEGRGADPSWPPEESVLALDIPEHAARAIGRAFHQLAVVVGRRGTPARLLSCL
jgi:hypothetical protein